MYTLLFNYTNSLGYDFNSDCVQNSLITTWYVDIKIEDVSVVQLPFFSGTGYSNPVLSVPSLTTWVNGLTSALDNLETYGYNYYFTNSDTVVVYNSICSENQSGITLKLNVGVDFDILCTKPTYTKSLYE